MSRLRIAVIESPNPIDLFERRSEAQALTESCRLMGHQAMSFFVRSRREFKETIGYIGSADADHAERQPALPLILHISAHGNSGCLGIGKDDISWEDLVNDIAPLIDNPDYNGKLVLSLSSCDSGSNTISEFLNQEYTVGSRRPEYIFSIMGETVNWDDALIAWNLLYLKLSRIGLKSFSDIKSAIDEVYSGTGTLFSYSRWSDEEGKYRKYSGKKHLSK